MLPIHLSLYRPLSPRGDPSDSTPLRGGGDRDGGGWARARLGPPADVLSCIRLKTTFFMSRHFSKTFWPDI